MAVNKVIILGNLGKDPEVRAMSNGNEVATFSVATTDVWKDKTTGERKEKTEWHKIVVYSAGLVNVVKQYLKKGDKVYIEGSLQTREWVNKDGVKQYITEIVLQGFSAVLQLLSPKEKEVEENQEITEAFPNAKVVEHSKAKQDGFVDESIRDEIPF
jgi:single-strand DNA-binding protein